MQDRASERLQDQIIEEIKELESTKTEEALQIAEKEHDLWMYQHEKEEAKRLQGVTWAPPRNLTKWPDWEEARKIEDGEWRLEPEGEAEGPEIIIVSDAVGGTPVDLDMVQKVFGVREAKNGTETDELLQTGTDGIQRIWQNVEENSNAGRW